MEHESDFISWHGFKSYPLPIQNPFPVVMGGVKGKIFERTAQLGNGWFAPTGDPSELKEHLESLKIECEQLNCQPKSLGMKILKWIGLAFLILILTSAPFVFEGDIPKEIVDEKYTDSA